MMGLVRPLSISRLDSKRRVTLPKDVERLMVLRSGDRVLIQYDGKRLILEKC